MASCHHGARSKTDRELYVGTVSQDTDNTNMGTLNYDTASIGFLRASTWTADPFLGTIDDVRIYDRALSTAEISALAASPPGACANSAPTLTVNEPDGTSDSVTVGDDYSIDNDLADTDNTVTVAFYYDTDSSGLDGTAISGACATAAEGTSVTCTWDTTGMTPGSYYVYGVTNDGTNPDVTDYSPGQITINAAAITAIYYSVGTDATALYSDTASASSGTLTLNSAAASKIGVGDEIRVGAGADRYYITGRNSSTEFTIQNSAANGGTPWGYEHCVCKHEHHDLPGI